MLTANQEEFLTFKVEKLNHILIRGIESVLKEYISYMSEYSPEVFSHHQGRVVFEEDVYINTPTQGEMKASYAFVTGGNDVVVTGYLFDEDDQDYTGDPALFRIDFTASENNYINECL